MKYSLPHLISLTLCCYSLMSLVAHANDEHVELISTIDVPGNLIDKSGLVQELQPGIWHDLFGGISALEYTGRENLYVALPDRGPQDGAVDYSCRFHLVRIEPKVSSGASQFSIQSTVMLSDSQGRRFTGSSAFYDPTEEAHCRLDPEGVRKDAEGNYWVSDEYGPRVMRFSAAGKLVGEFPVPSSFAISVPGPDKKTENANNNSGRAGNRGMEGLAISDDGQFLYGLMQSPLLQDCDRNGNGKPTGVNCRLLKMDLASGGTSEFLYVMDDAKNKLNEILSIGDGQFLVIERDGKVGPEAKFKKIMQIDLSGAIPIEDLKRLPAERLPKDVVAVKKRVFIDLLDPAFGLSGDDMPEKIESLAFGPQLVDGRKLLLVASDNDFNKDWPTKIYCFAIGVAKEKNQTVTSR